MRNPIFAANWKMNLAPADADSFIRRFLAHYPKAQDRTVIFFPSAIAIPAVHHALRERSDVQLGVQNIHWEDRGAFTGENSAAIARGAGARYALVGHSERRHVFGETDDETAKKVAAASRADLTPVLCVGETLQQRERGDTTAVVMGQLRTGLGAIGPSQAAGCIIAYEPVWAIGTGKTATPEDAGVVHAAIRQGLRSIVGERSEAIHILYGGSVNRGNAAALLSNAEVDGLLVGGASLDAEGWSAIVRT